MIDRVAGSCLGKYVSPVTIVTIYKVPAPTYTANGLMSVMAETGGDAGYLCGL